METFKLIERISSILRSEERKRYAALGLQPIHGQVLEYLSGCNKYSNTHSAVAEYLGLTKGTVSQTIQILERKRFLQKQTDSLDGRVVHLTLTDSGRGLLAGLKPLELFKQAEQDASRQAFGSIETALLKTLEILQIANQSRSFGACRTCHHFAVQANHYLCGLTDEALDREDTDKLCRDHVPKTHSSNDRE